MYAKFLFALALSLFVMSAPTAATPATGDAATTALLERARLWESRGRPELAREMLNKLFRIAPENPDGLAELGVIEAHADKVSAARAVLERLRRVQPAHAGIKRIESLLRLAGADKDKLKYARTLADEARKGNRNLVGKAIAAYRELFAGDAPEGDMALEFWKVVALDDRQRNLAHAGLLRLVGSNPDNQKYRLALAAQELSDSGNDKRALRVVVELAQLPQFQRQAIDIWRRAVMGLAPRPENKPLLEEYLASAPNDLEARLLLKSYAEAEEIQRRLMADPVYRARIDGLALLDGENLDAAETHFERALRELPEDAEIIGGMGMVRLRQGHHAQALALFEQALRMQPEQASKWQALIAAAQFWGLMREVGDARSAGELGLAEDKVRAAMLIKPQEIAGVIALAHIRADQGDSADAERNYRKALEAEPANREALAGLIGLLVRTGQPEQARRTIAELTAAQRTALGKDLDLIEAGMLRQRADALIAQGRTPEATNLLEQAIHLDADDPWARFDLARLYAVAGDRAKGLTLFEELLARHPDNAAALYALALYRAGGEETVEALQTLERIGQPLRDGKITALQRELWVRAQTQRARDALRSGGGETARTLLLQAEKGVAGDADLSTEVALAWADIGEMQHGRKLLDAVKQAAPSLSPQWWLRYADVLARLGAEEELHSVFDRLAASDKLSATEVGHLADLREAAAIRAVDAHLAAGRRDAAPGALAAALAAHPESARLWMAQARIDLAAGRPNAAEQSYHRALAANAAEPGARDGLVRLLIAGDRREEALALLDRWQATAVPTDVDAQLALAGLLLDLKATARAKDRVDRILALAPNQPRALAYAGQIARAEGRIGDAVTALQRAAAAEHAESMQTGAAEPLATLRRVPNGNGTAALEIDHAATPPSGGGNWQWKSLAGMLDERAAWLSSAFDSRDRKGTQGTSQYNAREVPVDWRQPRGNDEGVAFRADLVQLRSGNLDLGDVYTVKTFGSLALCQVAGNCPAVAEQKANGTSVDIGYRRGDLRVDVGTTPLGFPVTHLVGGVATRGDLGPLSWSVDASRRPLMASLLSYAGTRDPLSGRVWGGVVATGVRVGLSRDEGGTLGFWSSLGAHRLTGENVKSNDRLQLMAGGYWRVINAEDRLLSVGLTGMDWHFSDDAGEYTFGHGGYYSPKSYTSLSLPLTYAQRFARFSYVVRAAVSTSRATTDAAAYYPTDSAMQAAAVARGIAATYAGSDGASKAKGRSFHIGGEYQMDSRLFIGGRIEIERSPDYAPNRTVFYLRYNLDRAAAQPVALQPEPVIPTSQY